MVEEVQRRLGSDPSAMCIRRETVSIPSARSARMGATHFLTKRLPDFAAEMSLHVPEYNLTRVTDIICRSTLVAANRTGRIPEVATLAAPPSAQIGGAQQTDAPANPDKKQRAELAAFKKRSRGQPVRRPRPPKRAEAILN